MRRTLFALAPLLLLTGCAVGLGEPETVNVTVTEVVDAPEEEVDVEADAAPEEEEPAPEPEPEPKPEPAAPAPAGGFVLDPAYQGQVGGKCGKTPEGATISAGDNTSCDLAAAAYNYALGATWTWSNKPGFTSVPHTDLSGVPSPVTGGSYDLSCAVGSSGQTMSCEGPDQDPRMSYTLDQVTWHPRINIVGEYPSN